jgi:hypothetical protein
MRISLSVGPWIVAMAIGVLSLGCGEDSSADGDGGGGGVAAPAATPMAGTVGGMPWTLGTAETDAFFSDESSFWIDAYGETLAESCSDFPSSTAPSLILTAPPMPGSYPLGPTLTATFVLNDAAQSNLVATTGQINVESVTATQVTGAVSIEYDAQNTVSGRFTATICP